MIRAAAALGVLLLADPAMAEPFWRAPASGEIPPAAAGLAPAVPEPVGTCTAGDWNGDWYSIYGVLHLTVTGDALDGTYEYLNGHIAGTLDETGCQLTGRWDQDPSHSDPNDVGPLIFTLAADRRSWIGAWQFDSDPDYVGGWNGFRDEGAVE